MAAVVATAAAAVVVERAAIPDPIPLTDQPPPEGKDHKLGAVLLLR
jgi:hypothetical protein